MTPVRALKHTKRRAAPLPVSFFTRPAEEVAPELLGALLVSTVQGQVTAGRIVETEAYLGRDDPASHGYKLRRTERNAALFGPPGSWYVYRSYGMHWCANLVCQSEGLGSAVLIRALEPLEGLPTMRRRRGALPDPQLCAGPGRLCQALGISRDLLDGTLMAASPVLAVEHGDRLDASEILATPRIGITKAAEWPLRFVVRGSPWASGRRALNRG